MWQRIQSVFLVIVVVCLVLGLLNPVWVAADQVKEVKLFPVYLLERQLGPEGLVTNQYFPFCLSAILMVAAATIAVMEFRRFENRMLQVKLGTLNSLLLAGVMICDILFSNQISRAHAIPWAYGMSLWLTFGAIVFNWLAVRFIRRDEKLVKDSDRIR